MHIIHIASELAPIAKVGGLGDVIYGLSKELVKLGHTVEIILPKYDCLHYSKLEDLKVEQLELWTIDGSQQFNNTIWSAKMENLQITLIEPHHPSYFFSRGAIYGQPDDIDRFLYFSRIALEYLHKKQKTADILHVHDWPTAIIPALYREVFYSQGLRVGGTMLTIHNLEHQGKCSPLNLNRIGLNGEQALSADRMQDPYSPTLVNILKGGIAYADHITTVSPNYLKEILTPEGGCGLHLTLQKHRNKLSGILNGIDEHFWNPEVDHHLTKEYPTHAPMDVEKFRMTLQGKAANRKHVRTHLRMDQSKKPIVTCVTRLVTQKGPHLIKHAIDRTLEKGGQFILLGSNHHSSIHDEFVSLQKKLAGNRNVAIQLDKDEALAHLIYAAADMFIIPSLFEPCGLTQMIALRYGTVPIARMTGGLVDTVFDIDTSNKPAHIRNGYTFDFPDAAGVNWALDRAITCWKTDIRKWHNLMQNGMAIDFSWRHAAPEYLAAYQKIAKMATRNHLKAAS